MPTRVKNFGPGDDVVYGKKGWDEILNLGGGEDIAITGGGGRKSVNSGNDHQVDKIYSESLPGFGNPWIGGHRLVGGVYDEFHDYHLGMGDQSRISLADWSYNDRMLPGKVPGLFAIHGPNTTSSYLDATWLKSTDLRSGAQQISMAGEDADVIRFWGTTTRQSDGTGFVTNVSDLWIQTRTGNPSNDFQTVRMDDDGLATNADFPDILTNNGTSAEIATMLDTWVDKSSDGVGYDWLLLDG